MSYVIKCFPDKDVVIVHPLENKGSSAPNSIHDLWMGVHVFGDETELLLHWAHLFDFDLGEGASTRASDVGDHLGQTKNVVDGGKSEA